MLEPLREFICDSCGRPITDTDNGWVEWESFYDKDRQKVVSRNFRICHHEIKCQKLARHPNCSDLPLSEFLGEMAIVQTTSMLDIGPYHNKDYPGPEPDDLREFTDFLRRLTLPYYEEARQWWHQAMHDGYFGDSNEILIYLPKNLKAMIKHYQEENHL